MNRRLVLAGLGLAVVAVFWTVTQSWAQRERPPEPKAEGVPAVPFRGGPMHQPGRFICAYGSAERVLVLDTATGQVYGVYAKDIKTADDLAKVREMPPGFERPRDPGRRPGEGRGDGDRPREGLKKEKEKERPPFEKEG